MDNSIRKFSSIDAMKGRVATLIVAFSIAGTVLAADSKSATGQRAADTKALEQAEDALFHADVSRDLNVIRRGMADEVYIVHNSGEIQNRTEFVETTEKAEHPITRLEIVERVARVFGDVGISRGIKDLDIELTPGNKAHIRARYLAVYLKRDGRWQLLELRQIGAGKG
jgi:ketosteroid isomerase-like protein